METKANYLLIGAFTLASIAGAFALFLWLASIEIDRQYAYYDVLFDDVSGVSAAADVRYNGLPVGQVVDLALDPEDPSKVRIVIEVGAGTPVNTETVAKLQSQGVTGVSYVALSGGTQTSEPLPEGSVIPSERSALQSVFEGAPQLLETAIALLEDVNDVFDDQNRDAITRILDNAANATARLDGALSNFETLSNDLSLAAREVAVFADRLDELADTAETTLITATATLESATVTFDEVTEFTRDDLPEIVAEVRGVVETADRVIERVGVDVTAAVAEIAGLTDRGSVALDSATETFDIANETLDSITVAMGTAEDTLATAQQTFASANQIMDTQIDGIVSDLRQAVQTVSTTVENASQDIDFVAEEVRFAATSAGSFLSALEQIVVDNRRQVSDFLGLGLPEFTRLTEEARALVSSLDRLVDRAGRDPARFLLGTTSSEFRR